VTPDDVKALAVPVLAHRLSVRAAYGQTGQQEEAVKAVLEQVETPTENMEK
ncbi:MAG: magnesium chelatase, partial [Clostridia bacterium]|nr:magnesium chelatase [Clostridia bacterium]